MAGKGALLLVVGFSLIFLTIGKNFGGLSTRAIDNFADYHAETVSHDIAVTGANMAANRIFFDPHSGVRAIIILVTKMGL